MDDATRAEALYAEINEILLRNGWDYDARKRVLFMLKNRVPVERTERECVEAVYRRYGTSLTQFFEDAYRDQKSQTESRKRGGV